MAFQQVKDIISDTCREHQMIAEYYEEMQEFVEEGKVRSLLERLYQHEEEIIQGIRSYLKDKNNPTLKTWFQYIPDMPKASELIKVDLQETTTPSEVLELNSEITECFIYRYTKLSNISPSTAVHDLFYQMVCMEKNEGHRDGWYEVMQHDM